MLFLFILNNLYKFEEILYDCKWERSEKTGFLKQAPNLYNIFFVSIEKNDGERTRKVYSLRLYNLVSRSKKNST